MVCGTQTNSILPNHFATLFVCHKPRNKNISDKTLLNSIDISKLASGIYLLNIHTINNTTEIIKINVSK
jgi:hypothetical protein